MERQHLENPFRRYKGKLVTVRTISGSVYKGQVTEITNDYVLLNDHQRPGDAPSFVVYNAIESIVVDEPAG